MPATPAMIDAACEAYETETGHEVYINGMKAALEAAEAAGWETGLFLCEMLGGVHEGTCPMCGCHPLPCPPALSEESK